MLAVLEIFVELRRIFFCFENDKGGYEKNEWKCCHHNALGISQQYLSFAPSWSACRAAPSCGVILEVERRFLFRGESEWLPSSGVDDDVLGLFRGGEFNVIDGRVASQILCKVYVKMNAVNHTKVTYLSEAVNPRCYTDCVHRSAESGDHMQKVAHFFRSRIRFNCL